MTSQIAEGLKAVAPSIIVGTMFLDPFEHVGELLKTPQLLGDVRSSLCWYVDIAYVRELRNVFWSGFNDLHDQDTSVEYNDFLARMHERDFAQYITAEQGFEAGSGPLVVRQLGRLRAAWYDSLNAQTPMPSLEDLLANEKPPRVGAIQYERLDMLAKHMAGDDKELYKQYLDNLVARENTQAQYAHTNRQRINACLHLIASFCEATDTAVEFQFHQLPNTTQKRLIEAVPQILNNVILRMSRDRKMSTLEYSACMIEAGAAIKAFNKILATPRWAAVEI